MGGEDAGGGEGGGGGVEEEVWSCSRTVTLVGVIPKFEVAIGCREAARVVDVTE